jgi:hypothetical protein
MINQTGGKVRPNSVKFRNASRVPYRPTEDIRTNLTRSLPYAVWQFASRSNSFREVPDSNLGRDTDIVIEVSHGSPPCFETDHFQVILLDLQFNIN